MFRSRFALRRRGAHSNVALAVTLAVSLAVSLASRGASAQALQRFHLRGEFGPGLMLVQAQDRQFTFAIQGAGRLGITIAEPFGLQLSFGSGWFAGPRGEGQSYLVGGGLFVEPRVGSAGRFVLDANAGGAFTGPFIRFGFDVGLGFEFALARFVGLGPFVRYNHVFPTDTDDPTQAIFLTGGAMLSLRVPPPTPRAEPTPGDTDGDGVIDPDDQCLSTPAGDHPDPERRGCPMDDRDHDGVLDSDDRCPETPAGDHPDPARRGCPAADGDHDGVVDPDDQCPTTPAGEHPDPDRRGCPDGDDDSDGVLNHDDACRNQPPGNFPDPNRRGCPMADRDGDAVADDVDRCPDQPGAPSRDPARNGCPGLVTIHDGQIRIARPVFFATRRDRILPRSTPVLIAVAEAIRLMPSIHVAIDGHTDDVGDDAFNMDLSRRRAQSVRGWLGQHGIEASRLSSDGFGETRPLAPTTGLRRRALNAARAQNRRVEFRIQAGSTRDAP